ncbi:MAG: LEA type 2 family protein [Spirochaetaceae bacterium]|nr:LEA type 2 family protein [Spirochaetaceae bacterium]
MKNIILLTMISVLFISCSSLRSITQEPEVNFDSVRIANINFTSADFIFRYNVNNPNNASLNIDQFTYVLFVEGNKFISGVSPAPISIAKRGISYVDVPVTIAYKELFNTFSAIYRQDTANYNLATEFTLRLPIFGRKVIPIEHSGTFPVLKLPEIAFREIRVLSINPLAAAIELSLDITNRNNFAITPDSFNFELYINRSQWLSGLLNNIEALAPNRSTTLRIPININPAQVGHELFNHIFLGANLDVLLRGNMAMRTAFPGIGTTNIPFSIERTMPINR